MWTESPDIAEAHVFEGVVRAEPLDAPRRDENAALMVTAGHAVQWDESAGRLVRIPVDHTRFAETLAHFRPLHPIEIANTGRGLLLGNRDPRWRITAGHASGGTFPALAEVGNSVAGYLDNAPKQSQWVSVHGGTTRGVDPYTQYTFETRFDLTGVDPSTVHLVGQVLVDNRVEEIRLNGKRVDIPPWQSISHDDFRSFHVVEIRGGFASGANWIEFDVINGATVDGLARNPMALRVEWQAFGCVAGG